MADYTLSDALALTQTRILTLAQYALPTASGAWPYSTDRASFAQYFEFLLQGYDVTMNSSQSQQRWTWKADLRYKVGGWTEGADGQVQAAADLYIVSAAQTFVQWRGLNDPTVRGSPRVPFLDAANTTVHNARKTIENAALWLVFPWTLYYDTFFPRCGQ